MLKWRKWLPAPAAAVVSVAFICLIGVQSVCAQSPQADVLAKGALEQKLYPQVITAYQSVPFLELSDRAQYRLAIAYQKLGQFVEANQAIKRALVLNTKASFATSPDRLVNLVASIDQGLASRSSAGVLSDASASKTDAAPDVVRAAVLTTGTSVAPASTASSSLTSSIIAVGSSTSTVTSLAPALVPAAVLVTPPATSLPPLAATAPIGKVVPKVGQASEESIFNLPSLLIALFVLAGLVLIVTYVRHHRNRSQTFAAKLESLRDATAELILDVERANCKDSQLYAQLVKVLPVLELETGRSKYRASGRPGALTVLDRKAVELIAKLEKGPLRIGAASPEDIQAKFASSDRARSLTMH